MEKVTVKVIKHYGDVILVEYRSEKGLERCFIPADEVAGASAGSGQVSKLTLEQGIPYGVDLEVTMTALTFSPEDLMHVLKERGLWTAEDYRKNPRVIQGALQWMFRADVNRIIGAANNSMKEVN